MEIVDLFEGEQLKLGRGSAEWRRLFYLVADEFARLESLPFHDNTIKNRTDEIKQLCNKLNIVGKLSGYTLVSSFADTRGKISEQINDAEFCILVTNRQVGFWIKSFKNKDEALNYYIASEKLYMNSPGINVLMIKTSSIKQIKAAYPNYFADSRRFLENLTIILNA